MFDVNAAKRHGTGGAAHFSTFSNIWTWSKRKTGKFRITYTVWIFFIRLVKVNVYNVQENLKKIERKRTYFGLVKYKLKKFLTSYLLFDYAKRFFDFRVGKIS